MKTIKRPGLRFGDLEKEKNKEKKNKIHIASSRYNIRFKPFTLSMLIVYLVI